MNVLQILPELNAGGVETGTLDLAKYLVRLGHKSIVVSNGGELVTGLIDNGASHYRLPVHSKNPLLIFRQIFRLIEIIKKEQVDIVHARSRAPAWAAYFACKSTGTVFVTTCHGYYGKQASGKVMAWGRRVIVPSSAVAKHMAEGFLTNLEKIRLIPRGVDLEKFTFFDPEKKRRQGSFKVGMIGRITRLKGHPYFIKAMARLACQIPGLKILIVGDAPASKQKYLNQLKKLIEKLGLSQITEFLGSQKDIPAILSQLDVLVMATTTQEAFGRVIVEAQASGVPVIATKVGGVMDIIKDEETGLLIPPGNAEAISGAALKIFKEKETAAKIAQSAYIEVREKFNLDLMGKRTLAVYEEALSDFNILLLKFSTLGDTVLSTAAVRAVREKFKYSSISLVVEKESEGMFLNCPYIDHLITYDSKEKDKGIFGFTMLASYLRKQKFDMVIDLQNNRRSHLLSFLGLIPFRYGYGSNKLGFLLNRRVKVNSRLIDPVSRQFKILNLLGINLKQAELELWPSQEDKNYVERFLISHNINEAQRIVGLNISASRQWESKNWPLSHIARLCIELSKNGLRPVITGVKEDIESSEKLMQMAKGTGVVNACGKTTLNQLACLIKRCDAYVSCDSAPLHVSASQGTPIVALFGPTDYRRHLPPGAYNTVLRKHLSCSPCYRFKCGTGNCMNLISPQEVLGAVLRLLKINE